MIFFFKLLILHSLSNISIKYEASSRLFFCLPGPVMMSLKPGSQVAELYSEVNKERQSRSASAQLGYIQNQLRTDDGSEDGNRTADGVSQMAVVNGDGYLLCSPPRTENEVAGGSGSSGRIPLLLGLKLVYFCLCLQLLMKFHKQQEEIRRLRELLNQRDVHIRQLELEIKNMKNSHKSF